MSTPKGDVQLQSHVSSDTSPSIEGDLIVLAQKGDEQAFGQIYDIWAQRVYRFVYFRVKDVASAEELTSEIFLKAWQKLHLYRPQADAKFSTWLYAVARNAVIDFYRKQQAKELSFEDLPEIADLEGPELYAQAGELEALLAALPTEYERVLRLRFVEGYSIAKTAQVLRKKEDNIRAISSRGLKRMRELLDSPDQIGQ